MECPEFNAVLDRRIPGQNPNCEILPDVLGPTALADSPEPERDRLIKAFGSDFGRVLDSFGIPDGDAAGTERHRRRVAYSPYIRHASHVGSRAEFLGHVQFQGERRGARKIQKATF